MAKVQNATQAKAAAASIFAVLAEIISLLSNYGPLAVEFFAVLRSGGFAAALVWVENLLHPPTPLPTPAPPAADLQPLVDKLKAALA